ncbi:MAG: carboxylating nicotinate-nucleotide diphosphorylase [Ignavibacteria bacterium]|nr:carboxylating nicotinate-nucleotide diphosphorylase [Ignavibacteria bacterium]
MTDYYKGFDFRQAESLINLALKEDKGTGDVTSNLLIPAKKNSVAEVLVKESCVSAGLRIFKMVFAAIDARIRVTFFVGEGERVRKGQVIGEVCGNTRNILLGERLALNLLQRMCGIATGTNELVRKLGNPEIRIIDTRKTTPNMRLFEKLAVKIGGGENHRMGLYDMMLIKDNHIEASGGIEGALRKLKAGKKKALPVEIEVKDLDELRIVAESGKGLVDRVMLDNFKPADLKEALRICGGMFEVEVSGGINSKSISKYKKFSGIDFISVGALTHSARSVDISLDFIT